MTDMQQTLQPIPTAIRLERAPLAPASLPVLLPTLWRDPHSVAPEQLKDIVARLETACAQYPESADLRTCLGMAHAIGYDAYRSQDAFEQARLLDPQNFWAQLKYSELMYRLRALPLSEKETLRALDLAQDSIQIAMARRQLQEIRRLMRKGTKKPEWTKSLGWPALILIACTVAASLLRFLR